jgi:hypothetical protein
MIALAVIAFWAVAAGAAVNILQLPISLPDTLRSVCCGVNGKQLASGIIFAILIFKALYVITLPAMQTYRDIIQTLKCGFHVHAHIGINIFGNIKTFAHYFLLLYDFVTKIILPII